MSPSIDPLEYETANRPIYRGLQISVINVFCLLMISTGVIAGVGGGSC